MNPGKIVDAPPMTANLRYGGKYKAPPGQTFLQFLRQAASIAGHRDVQGAAVCKKKLEGQCAPPTWSR